MKKVSFVAGLALAGLGVALLGMDSKVYKLEIPLGLPAIHIPPDNPLTQEKIDLGRRLFMDRRLSHNNTLACGMCHVPEQGLTSHELGTAIGLQGRTHRRNSPSLYNVAYQHSFFHDGREPHLEDQVWGPLLAKNEMDMPSIGYVVEKVRRLPEYEGLFERAFGGPVTAARIGFALGSYQRTLISGNSRFDRWYYAGEKNALNAQERRGFEVFRGKGRCIACHTVNEKYALFTDHKFHNTGIGWERTMFPEREVYKVQLAPGVFVDVGKKHLQSFEQPLPDVGRYEVTFDPKDRWAYRTPILRNAELTSPYMHDGSLSTLEEVVDFYDKGGIDNPGKSPLLQPLGLTAEERSALVAFLKSLTGDNVAQLTQDARREKESLPVLPTDPSDMYMRWVAEQRP